MSKFYQVRSARDNSVIAAVDPETSCVFFPISFFSDNVNEEDVATRFLDFCKESECHQEMVRMDDGVNFYPQEFVEHVIPESQSSQLTNFVNSIKRKLQCNQR